MNLPLFISRRYLFARKSHSVINIISAISAVGMAVGTAALVLILSVYNHSSFNTEIDKYLCNWLNKIFIIYTKELHLWATWICKRSKDIEYCSESKLLSDWSNIFH